MRIYYVEDNPDLREEISFQLGMLGHEVLSFECGSTLWEHLLGDILPDVLLLDLGLPDMEGIDIAKQLRARNPEILIVMMTARGEVDDRAAGWNAGADAYLTKPVHLKELCAVLDSLKRRHQSTYDSNKGTWVLDLIGNRLCNPQGECHSVNQIERTLLEKLCGDPGMPVKREELVAALGAELWQYDMRRLEAAVSRLRKKITDLGGDAMMIRSVRSTGYLLACELKLKQ